MALFSIIMKTIPTRELFLEKAISFLGYPSIKYINASKGKNPTGFDCSGFVVYILKSINFVLPSSIRHCNEFFDSFGVLVHREHISLGDLIFFSREGTRPTHIGIMVDGENYIHAPGLNGTEVCIEKVHSSLIKPLPNQIYTVNPIGFKRLSIKSERWQKIL